MGEIWGRVIVTPHPGPLSRGEGERRAVLELSSGERGKGGYALDLSPLPEGEG